MASFSGKPKADDQKVKNLVLHEQVFERFVIVSAEIKSGGKRPYWLLEVGDATGRIRLYVWDVVPMDATEFGKKFPVGKVAVFFGKVKEYEGRKKIDVTCSELEKHYRLCEEDEVDFVEFSTVACTKRDVPKMLSDLRTMISGLSNTTYRAIAKLFFDDEVWVKKFSSAVAARTRHHNWQGGLLEHVWSMASLANSTLRIHDWLDFDLLLTGILFHDLSKMDDYAVGLAISMNADDRHRLTGHMARAQMEIEKRLFASGQPYDQVDLEKLLHLVCSHHGVMENGFGSSVSPYLPEAWALHCIDMLDAKIVESRSYVHEKYKH